MNSSKIDSLVDQIISKHESREDAISKGVFAIKMKLIDFIVTTAVFVMVFSPVIFVSCIFIFL